MQWRGWMVRQRAEVRGQRSGSGYGFVLEDIGGEMLMPRDCPEFGGRAGTRRGGVKAPEGWRSPRPGGLRGDLGLDEHPWGLRRRVSEVDRGVVRMRRIVESGCGFVLEDIGGEMLMPRKCPEFGAGTGGGWRGVKAVEGSRSPSPGGITARLDEHERGLHRGVREAAGGWRLPRWRRLPNLHGVLRCQEVWPSPGKATPQTPFENPGIYRMGLDVLAVRCSGRM